VCFNYTPLSDIYPLSLHDALPILEGMGAAYLPLPLDATLAVRAGGSAALGEYPFQEAAFLGGSGTLRGTPRQRFAGERAVYAGRSEEHTSELQSRENLVCRLLLEK